MSCGDGGDSSGIVFLPELAGRAGDANQQQCCWVPFQHLEGFKCHSAAHLCPDGSSEELITGIPLPSWRLWMGKKRLLVSVLLPT